MPRVKKPWYRPRNIALGLLGVVALWLGWGVYSAWTAKPGAAVDYAKKSQELVESYQPGTAADPNAWEPFMAAVGEYMGIKEMFYAEAGGRDRMPAGWGDDGTWGWPFDFEAMRNPEATADVVGATQRAMGLMRERGVERLLAEVAATPRAVRPAAEGVEHLIGVLLPELGESRQLARWCAARMRVAAEAGEMGEVAAAFEQGLALGRVVGSQWTLIDRLVGLAIVSHMLTEAKHEMGKGLLDAATCRELLAAIDRQVPLPPLEVALEGERLFMLDTIQWTHTDNGRGSGRLILTELSKLEDGSFGVGGGTEGGLMNHPVINIVGYLYPSKAETTARATEFYDNCIRISRLPATDRGAEPFNPDAYVQALPRGFTVIKMLTPALGKALQSNDQHEIEVRGTRLMLALEIYRAEQGAYPDRLDDLVPGVLAAVPTDPFSGRPYAYRLLSAGEAQGGWPYTLYSVGADGVDDAGSGDASRPYEALRDSEKGTDFIVNPPK